jgi:hypothetical protein
MAELDNDLQACLENNPQPTYAREDIAEVLAVWQGENDGDDWRWILRLNDGRFVYLKGGCDYTGWDCRSYAESRFAGLPDTFLMQSHGEPDDVIASLRRQLKDGKDKTWHERKGEEFGNPPFVE